MNVQSSKKMFVLGNLKVKLFPRYVKPPDTF